MGRYRIFTNDRGTKNGIAMYSALKDVEASGPLEIQRQCSQIDAAPYAPAKAIHWPASAQSDEEKEWLKKHVSEPPS